MATKKRTELEEELMTDANIAKVIRMLNPEDGSKPWTKKEACQALGMAYNTTRLGNIIDQYKERQAKDAARRAEKRGKPATPDEVQYTIQEYLNGASIDAIAKDLYRTSALVKRIIEENAVPIRQPGHSYFRPELIPEAATRDKFAIGEVVYSARYDSTARIEAEQVHPIHGNIYRIWLLSEKWMQFAYQPAHELASLQHLRELGVKI